MRLFWRHGYEGVSIADLTGAIGIAPPSLYAAFGSKAGLWKEVLGRYEAELGCLDLAVIREAASLADGVRMLLERAVDAVTDPSREPGCMVSSGMTSCHPDHALLARDAAARREAMRRDIAGTLTAFVEEAAADRLARQLTAVMQGISIQAQDGVGRTELRQVAAEVAAGIAARFPPTGRRDQR